MTTGTRFGHYEIVALIGTGGMGEVYRAHDATLNRVVAIKVLLPAVANDPGRLARFSREAQALASLNHPNIAHVYGLDTQAGPDARSTAFIVMELVDGEELAQLIQRGPLAVDDVGHERDRQRPGAKGVLRCRAGAAPEQLASVAPDEVADQPQILPDG